MASNAKITMALPSKSFGELVEGLLAEARINIRSAGSRNSHISIVGLPGLSSGTQMRSADVAMYVAKGRFDVGITTEEVMSEGGHKVKVLSPLSFSRNGTRTRVVLFVHESSKVKRPSQIPNGATILTEYPRITRRFLRERCPGRRFRMVQSDGSTESHVPDSYPIGVCLVDSGATLKAHALREIATLRTSETVLVANPAALSDPAKREVIESLQSLLLGAVNARSLRILKMNVPTSALSTVRGILPKREGQSPTITRLGKSGYSSVEYVLRVGEVNELVPKLKRAGATYILVQSAESVIP